MAGCGAGADESLFCILHSAFFLRRCGGSRIRGKPQCSLRALVPTKWVWAVRQPHCQSRGLVVTLAAAARQAARCSSERGWFSLQALEAAPKAARERRWVGVRGS